MGSRSSTEYYSSASEDGRVNTSGATLRHSRPSAACGGSCGGSCGGDGVRVSGGSVRSGDGSEHGSVAPLSNMHHAMPGAAASADVNDWRVDEADEVAARAGVPAFEQASNDKPAVGFGKTSICNGFMILHRCWQRGGRCCRAAARRRVPAAVPQAPHQRAAAAGAGVMPSRGAAHSGLTPQPTSCSIRWLTMDSQCCACGLACIDAPAPLPFCTRSRQ